MQKEQTMFWNIFNKHATAFLLINACVTSLYDHIACATTFAWYDPFYYWRSGFINSISRIALQPFHMLEIPDAWCFISSRIAIICVFYLYNPLVEVLFRMYMKHLRLTSYIKSYHPTAAVPSKLLTSTMNEATPIKTMTGSFIYLHICDITSLWWNIHFATNLNCILRNRFRWIHYLLNDTSLKMGAACSLQLYLTFHWNQRAVSFVVTGSPECCHNDSLGAVFSVSCQQNEGWHQKRQNIIWYEFSD